MDLFRVMHYVIPLYMIFMDYPVLEKCMLAFQPDFVFHLAAQPLVRYGYEEPLETFNVNIMGTAHILNAIRQLIKALCGDYGYHG